ncbi:toxin-antitoxin system HicB family antitoxin [Nicoliella spurrieriana]|uniref:Toxin-antitoxin system HicB family antitoxin n=1 Tax=Nicoliella spurrieriana TaxID=2925830 RepID=A0A976X618_9LACO|nr:toxin-antitoxin system HicB family antitoxin [Nicoliella spurrieriana]UQS87226.1 toxin-antitoxin system HicB family antitoxin [Nicoliella spurrieriana]
MGNIKFTIDLDAQLANQIKQAAAVEHRTVDEYIQNVLRNTVKSGTLEQRQFVGRTVSGDQISAKSRLVLMQGIYYRYDLLNESQPTNAATYEVVGTNGNVLLLRQK